MHPAPSDQRLAELLEAERRLEARIRAAEDEARARIAAAREDAPREDGWSAEAQAEERADVAQHARDLEAIAEEARARVRRLGSVSDETIERLARLALDAVIGGAP